MNEAIRGLVVLGSAGFAFSVLLAFLSKKLKVEENPLVYKVLEILPGINCGACGFSGCRVFAESVVKNKQTIVCKPWGEEVNKKIASLLGQQARKVDSHKAVVKCGATKGDKKCSSDYRGPLSCASAHLIGAGLDCKYGCIGLGDCVTVCPVNVISLNESKISIDAEKCIGCGSCLKACPRNLFELVSCKAGTRIFYVSCNNSEKSQATRKVCLRGCVACGICTKVKDSPFYLEENLSCVAYDKVKTKEPLYAAQKKCPTHCIDAANV